MNLRVSRLDGRITLTVPAGLPLAPARAFAEEKADWLQEHLNQMAAPATVAIGGSLPIAGRDTRLTRGPRTEWFPETAELAISTRARHVPAAAAGLLKALARERLAAASDHHAARLGRPYTRLTLRDTRSRWGSCTSDGGLMYSWRLIMAPSAVLDYVAAHEVAHLAEMNHSPRFWAVVADLCPDYPEHRKWLRDKGQTLHHYRFTED